MASISLGLGMALAGGIGAAGSIAGGAIGANAAGNAASTQANAAEYNAQLQAELGQESLGYESGQYGNMLALEQPYLQSGYNANSTLDYLMGLNQPGGASTSSQTLSIPGINGSVTVPGVTSGGTPSTNLGAFGSLMSPYPGGQFQAPTLQQAQQQPGYQFGLQAGEGALQAGAAANGSLLTGGTQNALDQYAQNYADTNYNNVYNQAQQTYNTNYNVWSNQNTNLFNRLASLTGAGQTTAQQLSTAGLSSAGQIASTLGQTGSNIAQQNSNAAAATASGYIGGANAWGGALSGLSGNISQLALLQQLMGNNPTQANISSELGASIIPLQSINPWMYENDLAAQYGMT